MPAGVFFAELTESQLVTGLPSGTPNNTYQRPTGWEDSIPFTFGTITTDLPGVVNFSYAASFIKNEYDDWYDRIHITPRKIDLLNVVGNQSRTILVWNAFLTPKTLEETSFPSGDGASVISPVTTPYTIRPLELLNYTLNVGSFGSAIIDSELSWTISGEEYLVPVVGRRIIMWPFKPNWQNPFVESLEWLTDVFEAFSGDEQRSAIRSKPRRFFEFDSIVTKQTASLMSNLLWGWQNRVYVMPIWTDFSVLTTPVLAGSSVLNLSTVNRGYFVGGLMSVYVNEMTYEVLEVQSFTATTVTLAKPIEKSWAAGTSVYPMNIGRLPNEVVTSRVTDGVLTAGTSFACDPLQTNPYMPVAAAPLVYNGYEVILRKPNWAQPVELSNQYPTEDNDFLTGGVTSYPTTVRPKIARRWQWVLPNRTEATAFRALLNRLQGRAKAVYLPTWFDDFDLYLTETASSVSIRVKDNEFYRMVNVNQALSVIAIQTVGNAPIFRRVQSVAQDASGFVVLGLEAAIGVELTPLTLKRISLVHLCRQTIDRVTLNWITDSVITVEANFTLVKA